MEDDGRFLAAVLDLTDKDMGWHSKTVNIICLGTCNSQSTYNILPHDSKATTKDTYDLKFPMVQHVDMLVRERDVSSATESVPDHSTPTP